MSLIQRHAQEYKAATLAGDERELRRIERAVSFYSDAQHAYFYALIGA